MCGIAGYIGKDSLERSKIEATLRLMDNRGPDCHAWKGFDAGPNHVYLLHSRLAIIDLDKRSNQPFTIGDHSLVYNGEIYNYKELRANLRKRGVVFTTDSDTEVLLQSFILDGERCVEQFEGMWAFAIYNLKTHQLFLSRDRFAEKPLYLWPVKDGVYFASEIKFLKSLRQEKPAINQRHLARNLINGYKSLYKTDETFFEGITEVPYATQVTIGEDLRLRSQRYWSLQSMPVAMTMENAIAQVREGLLGSIELRLRADVPVAFCLSGGVDSAAITSIARKCFNYDVATFSIIDQDERYNELGNIQATVRDLRCSNTLIHIERAGAIERLRKLVAYHDGPLLTISYFVHSFLSEAIAAEGYKVVCSGTGADELFTGYYDHFNLYLHEMKGSLSYPDRLKQWQEHVLPFIRNPYLKDPDLYADAVKVRSYFQSERGLGENTETHFCASPLRNRMLNEMFHEAVPVILHEDDLNSMYYSVENRSPYLDRKLFETAMRIPTEYLIHNGFGKYILREAVKGILNDKVRLDRQKKGFNASINSIIDFDDTKVREYLLEDGPVYKIIERDKVKGLLAQNTGAYANQDSKFLFSFINTKIFLEQNQ